MRQCYVKLLLLCDETDEGIFKITFSFIYLRRSNTTYKRIMMLNVINYIFQFFYKLNKVSYFSLTLLETVYLLDWYCVVKNGKLRSFEEYFKKSFFSQSANNSSLIFAAHRTTHALTFIFITLVCIT